MPFLKGNLHAHTTFSDGRRPVDHVIARYRDLGYDFLAVTDHDDRVDGDYWFQIPTGDDRLLVLPGIEIDYRPLSQHVGKVVGDRETLYVLNHPARYYLRVEAILKRIDIITNAGLPIHAIEVTDTGVHQAQHAAARPGLRPARPRLAPRPDAPKEHGGEGRHGLIEKIRLAAREPLDHHLIHGAQPGQGRHPRVEGRDGALGGRLVEIATNERREPLVDLRALGLVGGAQ